MKSTDNVSVMMTSVMPSENPTLVLKSQLPENVFVPTWNVPSPIKFVPKNHSMDNVMSAEKETFQNATDTRPVSETTAFVSTKCVRTTSCAVSYTHLTLPTICSV